MVYARHWIARRNGLRVVDFGQPFDLLDVENRVALHVGDFVLDIFAALHRKIAALQKAPTPHSFLRDRTSTAASLRRAHFLKDAGALDTFSVYCSTENRVYTLTAKME